MIGYLRGKWYKQVVDQTTDGQMLLLSVKGVEFEYKPIQSERQTMEQGGRLAKAVKRTRIVTFNTSIISGDEVVLEGSKRYRVIGCEIRPSSMFPEVQVNYLDLEG